MPRVCIWRVLITVALAGIFTRLSCADEAPAPTAAWKAGVVRIVITPAKSVWLAGYGSKRPPDGKLHDLWMKALALEDAGGRRAVLITSDFQGVPRGVSDRVFEQLPQNMAWSEPM